MKLLSLGASTAAYVAEHLGFLDVYSLVRKALTYSQVAILMYHRVSSGDPPWYHGVVVKQEDFEREIVYLCKVAQIVSLDLLVERISQGEPVPSRAACITFDDGYKDNYTFAYPILRKYNVPATIFLTTGYIGRSWPFHKARFAIWNTHVTKFKVKGLGSYCLNSLSDRLSVMQRIEHLLDELPAREKNRAIETLLKVLDADLPSRFEECHTLSWDEILEMSQNGISFGAHTVTHTTLTKLPIEEAREEIIQSKNDIEKRLGAPCTLFAYPNGEFNTKIIELLKENGFTGAVTIIPGMITKRATPFMLNRITAGSDFYTFNAYLSGFYPDLMRALRWVKGRGY